MPFERRCARLASLAPDRAGPRAALHCTQVEPFNSEKKLMGVVVRERLTGNVRVFWKGASEIVLGLCTEALQQDGSTTSLAGDLHSKLEARYPHPPRPPSVGPASPVRPLPSPRPLRSQFRPLHPPCPRRTRFRPPQRLLLQRPLRHRS